MDNKNWYAKKKIRNDVKSSKQCESCGQFFWMPKSKIDRYKCCSSECSEKRLLEIKSNRARNCITCGVIFYPRKTQIKSGVGIFCSQKCNTNGKAALQSEKSAIKRALAVEHARLNGTNVRKRGKDNPRWMGGRKESIRRNIKKIAAYTKKYRAENPEKTREWSSNRKTNKGEKRLPRGTVKRILELQKYMCAACGISIKTKFHVDHIVPLAGGGKHEPSNLQGLCQSCNSKKWKHDPVYFMQLQGFLL